MTRQEIIEKSAAYNRAVHRNVWPALILSVCAATTWMIVRSPRDDINFMFLVAVGAPIFVCLIPLDRLQKRLQLHCPNCQLRLYKPKIQQLVFEKGLCPKCGGWIIDDVAKTAKG